MEKLVEFNPLKSIAIPNVGKVQPRGLTPRLRGRTFTGKSNGIMGCRTPDFPRLA
jgi:hypothetical protein